jgi:transposase
VVPARSRAPVLEFPVPSYDPKRELVFVAAVGVGSGLLPAALRGASFRDVVTADPALAVTVLGASDGVARFEVSAKRWAHAVHFALPEGAIADDDWFDLLPGETRTVAVRGLDKRLMKDFRLEAKSVR